MRTALAAVAVGLLAAQPPEPDPAKTDLARLKGAWTVRSVEAGGMEMKGAKIDTIRFDGDIADGLGGKITVRLDPTRTPKEIDLVRGTDGRKWMGIYKIDGDALTLCMSLVEPGKVGDQKRPTDFDPKKVQMVISAVRAKP